MERFHHIFFSGCHTPVRRRWQNLCREAAYTSTGNTTQVVYQYIQQCSADTIFTRCRHAQRIITMTPFYALFDETPRIDR